MVFAAFTVYGSHVKELIGHIKSAYVLLACAIVFVTRLVWTDILVYPRKRWFKYLVKLRGRYTYSPIFD